MGNERQLLNQQNNHLLDKKDFLTLSVLHFVYMNESQLSRLGTILLIKPLKPIT